VSSRAAEHLFWLGRYVERAETCTRLLRTALTRLSDASTPASLSPPSCAPAWPRASSTPPDLEAPIDPVDAAAAMDPISASALIQELIDNMFEGQKRRSLAFNVRQTIRVAGAIRDRLSSDNWRLLNQLFEMVGDPPETPADLHDALAVVDRSITSLAAVAGLEMAHMTRDQGWRFLSVGRISSGCCRSRRPSTRWRPRTPRTARSSSGCSTCPTAWSRSARATCGRPSGRRSSSCCCSTPTIPARWRSRSARSPSTCRSCRDRSRCRSWRSSPGSSICAGPSIRAARILFAGPTWMESLLSDCQDVALQVSDALTSRYFSHAYELPHATRAGR
jgi:hypothetical protein